MTEGQPGARSNVPVPDPSVRSREDLQRELQLLRNELTREIDHARTEATARMDAIDKAAELRWEALQEVRPQTERLIEAQGRVMGERFESLFRMFQERDVRTQQADQAAKQALDAALSAAKELVTAQALAQSQAAEKAEVSTAKQIDQIGLRLDALRGEAYQRIDELKERITRAEGTDIGEGRQRSVTERGFDKTWVVVAGLVGMGLLVLTAVGVIVTILASRGTP